MATSEAGASGLASNTRRSISYSPSAICIAVELQGTVVTWWEVKVVDSGDFYVVGLVAHSR